MATRKIVKVGEDILRKKSKEVKAFDEDLAQLIDDMRESMYSNQGMGIAAVQVGVLRRIIVIDVNGLYAELVNPKIVKSEGETVEYESCLSVVNFHGRVKRPKKVTVEAFDRYGNPFSLTGQDWLARCLCHEIDHLDGILYVDKTLDKDKYLKERK